VLTCVFAMIMAAVCIGTIAQIVEGETRPAPGPDVTTVGKRLQKRKNLLAVLINAALDRVYGVKVAMK